ncbi:hypothetical protein [Mycobacteroides abscessus]|uniref:hypothetical protein n=1 Tax=Mycobacteroides abscessus TaxID=36809 RepID=UPI000925BEB0|nr:hypothetical protein [Mycobacteroides abscessus]MDO3245223.1 hypothetical protein [Mycobacteroides abscessus subsp. abscessus]MDO3347256.1 hypothetical protein [Mycobacteroides abscessus subsp. abscessus]SIC73694.1 Uncharacterised protein [Mycobacteroides abscessus subsp. abscessus]
MPLRDILAMDAPDDSPTGELITNLTEAFQVGGDGTYDIDEALFALALAVTHLEAMIIDNRAERLELEARLVNLETRILEAGVPLRKP